MTKFKVGDRVRYATERYVTPALRDGEGVVLEPTYGRGGRSTLVEVGGPHGDWPYRPDELTLVESEPKFKTGDRLRITVEGEFFEDTPEWLGLTGVGVHKNAESVDILNVEKVEPPVEVFEPGDTVRSKRYGYVYTLGKEGYLAHDGGTWIPTPVTFTSERYEKVNLAEVPF